MRIKILCVATAIASIGCNKQMLSQKQQVLAQESVFSEVRIDGNKGGEGEGSVGQTGGGGGEIHAPAPAPAPAPRPSPAPEESPVESPAAQYQYHGPIQNSGEIAVIRVCSDGEAIRVSSQPAITTPALRLIVRDEFRIVCDSTNTAVIKDFLGAGSIRLSTLCPNFDATIAQRWHSVSLTNANGDVLGQGERRLAEYSYSSQPLHVTYADNPEVGALVPPLFPDDDPTYLKCDQKYSPLFVDLRVGGGRFELTSPEEGIRFDIMGERAKPVPHSKKQIGWFKNAAMAMLVQPDSRGGVHGINQLFGDNTRGPDGQFAPDGFAALAKYDDQRDGSIDSSDEVYRRLRLWIDHDLNGIAGPGELISLAHLEIASIDLNYDPNFSEKDRYGNEVKYKSVVTFNDGSMKLIYDLWFLTRN